MDLAKTLVVGVSSTALFDLSEEDRHFREAEAANKEDAIKAYRDAMRKLEEQPLPPGSAMPVVKALLALNKHKSIGDPPIVEVVVMSRNSPETGVRVLNSIRSTGLAITRSAFTGGEPVAPLLHAYSVDLFLTTDAKDAQSAINARTCAAAIIRGTLPANYDDDGRVHIAFDGDAVLFDESSEVRYKEQGMAAFHTHESTHENTPLGDGPYANLLRKIAQMQERLPTRIEYSPVRVSIVTARNAPSDLRVIKTLRHWGVYVDEAYFLGGLKKAPVLKAIKAHIFFDDQDVHLDEAVSVVPSGKVPYSLHSLLAPRDGGKS